jgi:hypothetical protein
MENKHELGDFLVVPLKWVQMINDVSLRSHQRFCASNFLGYQARDLDHLDVSNHETSDSKYFFQILNECVRNARGLQQIRLKDLGMRTCRRMPRKAYVSRNCRYQCSKHIMRLLFFIHFKSQ